MTKIHGTPVADARRYVGASEQLARIESLIEADGPARGARRLRLVTGGGLEVDLHPDRALDIGQVTLDGMPVSWMESDGIAPAWAVDPHGDEWLRAFGGGLMTTCGLDTFGPPTVDEGVAYGQHGRVSGIPARITRSEVVGDTLIVEGLVRQSRLNGERLLLHRRYTARVGARSIAVHDTVTNEGDRSTGHMMMYHINVGWPMIDEEARLDIPSTSVVPRDDGVSASGIGRWQLLEPPTAGRREEVFVHHFDRTSPGRRTARLDNPRRGIAMSVAFDTAELPWLCQWKLLREGTYVVGIEPVNSPSTTGRAGARADGVLPELAAGASAEYHVEISFSTR